MADKKSRTTPKGKAKNVAMSALTGTNDMIQNPWSDARKQSTAKYDNANYIKDVNYCRFFYKKEPMVSTVVNKLVEIGINDLVFSKNGLSENEFRVFKAIKADLLEFAESMAQEYLLSGLVVPEFTFKNVDKEYLQSYGIKKYSSLSIPDSLWLRDPKTINIHKGILSDDPTYFLKIPEEFVTFIQNKGKYPNGVEDKDLYKILVEQYPDLVKAVKEGKTEVLLENEFVIRRKPLPDNPYPIPYINSSLEALQHKRKLRRMDYSIIDKVISAIMHIRIGSDEFPITDSPEDNEYVTDIRTQMQMRANTQQNLERIFQLITNHTVEINWIFPDAAMLLDSTKYGDINQEILFGLGFPRILITGESEKTGTSDPEMAMIAPIRTMENFRKKVITVVREVCKQVSNENNFKNTPVVFFKEINMHKFADFINGINKLYEISAISRTDMAEIYGYDFVDQLDKITEERQELKKRDLPEVGLSPFSSPALQPGANGQPNTDVEAPKTGDEPDNKPQE